MSEGRINVGIIGCGQISGTYMKNIKTIFPKYLNMVACTDIIMDRARARGAEFGVEAREPDAFYASKDIQIAVSLTNAPAHGAVCRRALESGMHAYTEKPVCIELGEARRLLELSGERGLLFGCAPETFMGAGLQTAKKLLDDGWIGEPVAAVASMRRLILDSVPEWVYQYGAGPLFDMGPYYVTALVSLLGPVAGVKAYAGSPYARRVVTDGEGATRLMPTEVDTYIGGIARFASGVLASITTTFDVWARPGYQLEVNGREGSLLLPDPNTFEGPVKIYGRRSPEPAEVPLTHGFNYETRGIGVADMAYSLLHGRRHTANGHMGTHVLEVMSALIESSKSGAEVEIQSRFEPAPPLPYNYEAVLRGECVPE